MWPRKVFSIWSYPHLQNLEEEFNSRIEMFAVQMALLWPCFLFQQVPLARIFFLVIVITARSLRVVCNVFPHIISSLE